MKLSGLHLLLTYQCTLECDHCFVWGGPRQSGVMALEDVDRVLEHAAGLGTVDWIFFEGGEPFLYYGTLLAGVRASKELGFKVGLVSNAYWAVGERDALECLEPFKGLVDYLSISTDLFHWREKIDPRAKKASLAAKKLGISAGHITIGHPEEEGAHNPGESTLMYRGRAAAELAHLAEHQPWSSFTECPHEDLSEPGRLHLDPLGNLHICQGISVGNLFETPLDTILRSYSTASHPITGPLERGGPAGLVREYGLDHKEGYADACHLCYEARESLRERFGHILGPDQMYGLLEDG